MIYVTHDQTEAMTMADRMMILNGGNIQQVGRPLDIYNAPEEHVRSVFYRFSSYELIKRFYRK